MEKERIKVSSTETVPLPNHLTYERLVWGAIMNAKADSVGNHERWVAVRDTFAIGRGSAYALCEAYGLDPEAVVKGAFCGNCDHGG